MALTLRSYACGCFCVSDSQLAKEICAATPGPVSHKFAGAARVLRTPHDFAAPHEFRRCYMRLALSQGRQYRRFHFRIKRYDGLEFEDVIGPGSNIQEQPVRG